MIIYEAPDWTDWRVVVEVTEWRAARTVQARAIAQQTGSVDASSDQRVSRAVTEAYVATQVGEMIRSLSREGLGDSEVILRSLLHLVSSFTIVMNFAWTDAFRGQYLLSTAEAALVDLLSLAVISQQASRGNKESALMLRLELAHFCSQLLPEAISLSDAFGYSDWEIDRYVRR